MKYSDALRVREENLSLIGSMSEKGLTFNELLVVPSDEKEREKFFQNYLFGFLAVNATSGINTEGQEYEVWAIDTEDLKKNLILGYKVIAK